MAARFPLPPALAAPAPLETVLAGSRDAHARQRELVRASLFRCPDKGAAKSAALVGLQRDVGAGGLTRPQPGSSQTIGAATITVAPIASAATPIESSA